MEEYKSYIQTGNNTNTDEMFGTFPVILDYWGREKCNPNHTYGPFIRTGYLIHIVLGGRGRLYWRDKVYEVSEGQAFIIFPGEETTYQADEEDPWDYEWIGYHGVHAKKITEMAGFDEEHAVVDCANVEELSQVMDRLLKVQNLSYVDNLRRMSLILELLALFTENKKDGKEETRKTPEEGQNAKYVEMTVNLLMQTSGTPVKIAQIAKKIGISRSYLTNIFHQEMGMSPQMFQMNYRMEKAVHLLANTDNPINLIAEELGYSDSMCFSKAFRKRYGVSPSQYRDLQHKEGWRKRQKLEGLP